MGSRSSDAIHGAAARIKRRMSSSASKMGSTLETGDERRDNSRQTRPGNRFPASLAINRQNFERKNRTNSPKRRRRNSSRPWAKARPFQPADGFDEVIMNESMAQNPA